MRTVVYSMTVSLDGYIADPQGQIDWTAPDDELHRFHNQQARALGAHLCGRALYETMLVWERTDGSEFGAVGVEFAQIWKPLPKVVFSTTLSAVEGNARLAAKSLAEEVAAVRDVPDDKMVGGGGTPFFPRLDHRLELELVETRTFGSQVIYARYRRARS